MKKQVIFAVLAAASALGGVNLAQAQDGGAECQSSGRCGHLAREQGLDANGNFDPRVYQRELENRPDARPPFIYGYGLPQVLADGRLRSWPYGMTTPYARTERDRDGDGVRNSRDRYPDDPRYR